jgi:hypothetical protein
LEKKEEVEMMDYFIYSTFRDSERDTRQALFIENRML